MKTKLFLLLTVLVILFGCSNKSTSPSAKDLISINNNSNDLSGRIIHKNQPIDLHSIDGKNIVRTRDYTFTLIGELEPPTTPAGVELRATHIFISGNYAYVSYNKEGDVFAGGVDMINITFPQMPYVVSEGLSDRMDISSVTVDYETDNIYLGAAIDPDLYSGITSPAALLEIPLYGWTMTNVAHVTDLPSWCTTGVVGAQGYVFATTGNAFGNGEVGGVFALSTDESNYMGVVDSDRFNNAEYLDIEGIRVAAIEGGANAKLHLYNIGDDDTDSEPQIDLGSIEPYDGKSTVKIKNGIAYVALGENGMKAFDAYNVSNTPIYSLPKPVVPEGGNSSDYITNAVSADDNFVYLANGAGGLYVATIPDNPSDGLNIIGTMSFDSSANYVQSDNNLIFVASGTGGIKIIQRCPRK